MLKKEITDWISKSKYFCHLYYCESQRKVFMSWGVGWPAGACFVVFVYKCVYMDGETEPLQQGPRGSVLPSPALYEAVFWTRAQDQASGTLLYSSLSRLSLTLHQLGRHSTLCVLVLEGRCSFQLLLSESETNQSNPQIISSLCFCQSVGWHQ